MKFKGKLFTIYLLISLVPLFLLAFFAYVNVQKTLDDKNKIWLNSLLDNEVRDVRSNINIFRDTLNIKDNKYIRSDLATILSSGTEAKKADYDKSLSYLDEEFNSLSEQYPGINNVLFVNSDGIVSYDLHKKIVGQAISDNFYGFGASAFNGGQGAAYNTDLYPSAGGGALLVSAPVYNLNDEFLGVMMFEVDGNSIYGSNKSEYQSYDTVEACLVKLVDSKAKTADTKYIYNKNGDAAMFLNSLRFDNQAAFNRIVSSSNPSDSFQLAAHGFSGYGTSVDYRGQKVLAAWRYLPENNWGLVVKIDASEISTSTKILFWLMFLLISVAVIIIFLSAWFLAKLIYKPIPKLKLALEKIKSGDFEISFDAKMIKAKDELNALSGSFMSMVGSLKIWRGAMEKKVDDKTTEARENNLELDKQKKALISLLSDIDEERLKAEGMANDLEKFRLAVESSSDHIVITDSEGIVIYGNKIVEEMTGYKLSEAVGKKAGTLWKLPMPLEFYQNFWKVIKKDKKVFSGELQNRRKNGEIYTVAISVSPVLNKKNEIVYFVGVERDITREKQIDRAKTEFVSLISHQLRTPLSAISLFSEMLVDKQVGDLNKDQIEYVEDIRISNKRMITLVNSILNVSRLDMGTIATELKDVDLVELAQTVAAEQKILMLKKKIKFKSLMGPDIPTIKADTEQLRMVFQNLLSNATNYTPVGKGIELAISFDAPKKIISISVKDEGIGIPVNDQGKIFDKLFRSNNAKLFYVDGNGLGLYIVKSVVERLGGIIWFESVENVGTTFYINLPIDGHKLKQD